MNIVQQMRHEKRMRKLRNASMAILGVLNGLMALAFLSALVWGFCSIDHVCSAANGL